MTTRWIIISVISIIIGGMILAMLVDHIMRVSDPVLSERPALQPLAEGERARPPRPVTKLPEPVSPEAISQEPEIIPEPIVIKEPEALPEPAPEPTAPVATKSAAQPPITTEEDINKDLLPREEFISDGNVLMKQPLDAPFQPNLPANISDEPGEGAKDKVVQ